MTPPTAAARTRPERDRPRQAQINRLKEQVAELKRRVEERDGEVARLRAFEVRAVSQIAAQHEEIERLRRQFSGPVAVTELRPDRTR